MRRLARFVLLYDTVVIFACHLWIIVSLLIALDLLSHGSVGPDPAYGEDQLIPAVAVQVYAYRLGRLETDVMELRAQHTWLFALLLANLVAIVASLATGVAKTRLLRKQQISG